MTTTIEPAQPAGWRFRPIDGALFAFQPSTGTCVRWDAPVTRSIVAKAPRVVLFGITNACNLACGFCSRDTGAASDWDVDSAAKILSDLAAAGVLEVAFGGGEPLLFRGFDVLLDRLAEETPLAVHVTTNGTRIDAAWARVLAARTGEVRLSIYEPGAWRGAAINLAVAGARFGANVVVTPENLADIERYIEELAALGGSDIALLRYVGDDLRLHLTPADEARLEAIVLGASLPVKLSVCFGDRLPSVPRLFSGDCGAGGDFVTIASDRSLRGCSFQTNVTRVETAADVLDAWRTRRAALRSMADRFGCARPTPAREVSEGVRIWRAYAGNNSGDCVLVGRFESADEAEALVEDVLPGLSGDAALWGGLVDLLRTEGIELVEDIEVPDVAALGRSVLVMAYGPDDVFPWARRFVQARGGRAMFNGVHVHEDNHLVVGVRVGDRARREAIAVEWGRDDHARVQLRGEDVFATWRVHEDGLDARVRAVREVVGEHAVGAEIVACEEDAALQKSIARSRETDPIWLWCELANAEAAEAVARSARCPVARAGRYLVARVERQRGFEKLERSVYRAGGWATWLFGPRVVLAFTLGSSAKVLASAAELRLYTSPGDTITCDVTYERWANGTIETEAPDVALVGLGDYAKGRAYTLWVEARVTDPLSAAIARITSDLRVRRP